MTEQQSNPPPPREPSPVLDYKQPDQPRKTWKYVLAALGGFVAILVAGGIGTFAAMSANSGIPLFVTGGMIATCPTPTAPETFTAGRS